MSDLWEHDDVTVESLDIDVPRWIEQDISCADIAAIIQGGCASGAYMPAVTYYQARETMNECGDNVLDFIQEALGEVPNSPDDCSWPGMACHYVSLAVELWASGVESEIEEELALIDQDEE